MLFDLLVFQKTTTVPAPLYYCSSGVAYFFLGFDEVLSTYLNSGQDVESRIAFLAERNKVRDASLLLWILYGLFMDRSKFQGTHGKIILRIKVTDIEGNRITFKKILVALGHENCWSYSFFSRIHLGSISERQSSLA